MPEVGQAATLPKPLPKPEPMSAQSPTKRVRHPVLTLLWQRVPLGVLSIAVASVIVYWATLILPGDAATAILGQSATPERLLALREQLGLNSSPIQGFLNWAGGYFSGDFGMSLTRRQPVWNVVATPLVNSVVLVAIVAIISSILGIALGLLSARKPDGILDTLLSIAALGAAALPEFVVGVLVVYFLAVGVVHWFPAISSLPANGHIWDEPDKLVLPAVTLTIVVTPYVFRMVRAATIEALRSDYVEVAILKGTAQWRVVLMHALPNALAPTIQVIGINLLYLAGGIVLVETVFVYPGLGQTLVGAVKNRDVPLVQFMVIVLACFYVTVNILADLGVLLVTPKRRLPR